MAATRAAFGLKLIISPYVIREAERHQKHGHVRVSALVERFGWTVVPDAPDVDAFEFVDTDPKDRPVLATAAEHEALFLITGNVKDFGFHDLTQTNVTSVHPGLLLAERTSANTYRDILAEIAGHRSRDPRSPEAIHRQQISVELPGLYDKYRDIFGSDMATNEHRPPTAQFRGTTCVTCGRRLSGTAASAPHQCPNCSSAR